MSNIHILAQSQIIRNTKPILEKGWAITHFDGRERSKWELLEELNKKTDDKFICFVSIPIAAFIIQRYPHLANGLLFPSTYRMYESQNPLYLNEWANRIPKNMLLNDKIYYSTFGDILDGHITWNMDHVFIKPVSPWKPFAGFDCPSSELQFEVKSRIQTEHLDRGVMVGVSAPKVIDKIEWRCYAVDGEIVTAAPYSWTDIENPPSTIPSELGELAENAAKCLEYVGDPWVIDVATTEDGPKVIEVNAVPTSGWYNGMDTNKLLKKLVETMI